MNVPSHYKDASLTKVPKAVKEAVIALMAHKRGLYIYGGVGTGKTYIVWAIVNRLKEKHPDWFHFDPVLRIYNSTDLLERIRSTYDNRFDEFVDELLNYRGVLIIDDIGAERTTEWTTEQFYRLINRRYERDLPTFFTSNLAPQELEDKIGYRTVSRIIESCEVIELSGEDRRLVK